MLVGISAMATPALSQGATIIAGYDLFSTGQHGGNFLEVTVSKASNNRE